MLRGILTWLGKHWGFPGNAQWWWAILGLPTPLCIATGVVAWWKEASFVQAVLAVAAAYIVLALLVVVVGPLVRKLRSSQHHSKTSAGSTVIKHLEVKGDFYAQGREQLPVPPAHPELKASSPRYREDEDINIANLAHEFAVIRSGNRVVADWTFKDCRILDPAVLFVQEPKEPRTFITCKWAEGEQAFSIMPPEKYTGDTELVVLHQCWFLGCRFENVEMLVSQETYDRYIRGKFHL